MNFLRFLSSGANLLNFNFANPSVALENQLTQTYLPIPNNKPPQQFSVESQLPLHLPTQAMESPSLQQLLIKQQQQLLNQCIKLNLQLIGNTNKEKDQTQQDHVNLKKRIKKVNRCQHTDKKHYAKGLCNNCYHRYGRDKKPWNCKHDVLYAAGMCQNCYINRYNKMRRDQQKNLVDQEQGSQIVLQNIEEKEQKSQI